MDLKAMEHAGGLGPTGLVVELLEGTARELYSVCAALRELAELAGPGEVEAGINDQRTALAVRAAVLESIARELEDAGVLPVSWGVGQAAGPKAVLAQRRYG